jgi:hypothetical protein
MLSEMAELIGTIAAGFQMAEMILKLSKRLHRCYKTFRHAPHQIIEFKRETLIFSTCLNNLHSTADESLVGLDQADKKIKSLAKILKLINEQSNQIRKGIQNILLQVKEINTDSIIQSLRARLRWYLQQVSVKALTGFLNNVKLNVNMALGLLQCEILHRRIDELLKENQRVPAQLRDQM